MHDSLVHMSTCSSPFSWHSNLLAFDEEPLGIQHSNLHVRERNTLFKFTWYLNHFSLEQCLGESLSKFCVLSMLPLLNLEIALSAFFGNRRLSGAPNENTLANSWNIIFCLLRLLQSYLKAYLCKLIQINNCEDLLYIYFFIPQFKYMNFIYS